MTDGNGCQGVVYAETSRDVDFHIHIHAAGKVVGNAKQAWFLKQFHVGSEKVGFFRHAKGFQIAGMTVGNLRHIGIVDVDNTVAAFLE